MHQSRQPVIGEAIVVVSVAVMSDPEVCFLYACGMITQQQACSVWDTCQRTHTQALSPFHHVFPNSSVCSQVSAKERFGPTGVEDLLGVFHLTFGQPSILPGFSPH